MASLSQTAHRPADQPSGHRSADGQPAPQTASRSATGHQAVLAALAQQQPAMHRAVVTQPPKRQAASPVAPQSAQSQQAAPRPDQAATQQAAVASPTPAAATTPAPSATPTPAPSGSPQSIAQSMLKSFGWSADQFSCLQPLWQHESSWSVSASNSSTGAYGIPQAVPGSKMASAGPDWKTNPSTQIKWGLGYIKDTYGSPCGAWSHEQADGWY
ncbi:MAG TPA: lytic transglycosylase domain-containing protein [Streptosporangiaceae bacterium]